MLVPTVKAPHGKRRARIVICGNRIEAKNPDGQFAAEGLPGGARRFTFCQLCRRSRWRSASSAAEKNWSQKVAVRNGGREDRLPTCTTARGGHEAADDAAAQDPSRSRDCWSRGMVGSGKRNVWTHFQSFQLDHLQKLRFEDVAMGLQWSQIATFDYT